MTDDPRLPAAVDLIGRSGADHFELRYCDGHDGDEGDAVVVWMAVGHWPNRPEVDMPDHYDAAGGLTPWTAVFRLCEACMDGGTCRHCNRPTMVDDKAPDTALASLSEMFCAYRYDPELQTFRRSCEGVKP